MQVLIDEQEIGDYVDTELGKSSVNDTSTNVDESHPIPLQDLDDKQGDVIVASGHNLIFDEIHYRVEQKNGHPCKGKKTTKTLHILKGVSGVVRSGEMLAIIGSSGAGKSTLLDILAGRKGETGIEGQVMIDGEPIAHVSKRTTGYVTQEDVFKGVLTVREDLAFYANMTLPSSQFTAEQRAARVEEVMKDLKISHRADAKIGAIGKKGLSGGEKKRVAIGEQLVKDPDVLFLDEPTSGLDSYTSLVLLKLLRKLSHQGKTIIMTIHQPSSTIWNLFDRVMILDQGRTVYFGKKDNTEDFFASMGYPVPHGLNPADYFLDVLLSKDRANYTLAGDVDTDFHQAYVESSNYKRTLADIKDVQEEDASLEDDASLDKYAVHRGRQTLELLSRAWKELLRDPEAAIVLIVQAAFLGIIVGSIFYQLGFLQEDINSRVGLLFFLILSGAFPVTSVAIAVQQEKDLINRERASGLYSIIPYFFERMILDIPIHIIVPVLFSSITYWMVNLNNSAGAFFILLGVASLNCMVAGSFYTLIGALSPNALTANIMSFTLTVILMLFGGFFVAKPILPDWWVWMYYISFIRYSFDALMANEFAGVTFSCSEQEISDNICAITNGDQILKNFGITAPIWSSVIALICQYIIYRTLTLVAFWLVYKEKR